MTHKNSIKTMAKRPALRVVSSDLRELGLPAPVARLFHEMIDAYAARREGSLRHSRVTVRRDIAIVCEFVRFSHKPAWDWDETDFDRWCRELGLIRRLAPATQRHYQGVIRSFLDYLVNSVLYRDKVQRLFGKIVRQICTKDNCIPHVVDREMAVERRAMTYDEIEKFFATLDNAIDESRRFGAKDYRPLQRDKVFFFTQYAEGLRISEVIGLDVDSFHENVHVPEFGDFGFASVGEKALEAADSNIETFPSTMPLCPHC